MSSSGDSNYTYVRKLKEVWWNGAAMKSTSSKGVSFKPVKTSALMEALAKSGLFSPADEERLRARLDPYSSNATVTQERFVREALKVHLSIGQFHTTVGQHNGDSAAEREGLNTAFVKTPGVPGSAEKKARKASRLSLPVYTRGRVGTSKPFTGRHRTDVNKNAMKPTTKHVQETEDDLKQRLAASNGKVKDFEAQLKDVEEVHSKIVANLKKDVAVADSRAQLIEKSRSELQEKSENLKQQVQEMDKRNLELKQQLAASKEELSTKINDFEGRMKVTAETNAMTVANLQRDVIAADDRAQLIEWDRDELKTENEDLKKKIQVIDAHVEELAYSNDTAWELVALLEAKVEQLEAEAAGHGTGLQKGSAFSAQAELRSDSIGKDASCDMTEFHTALEENIISGTVDVTNESLNESEDHQDSLKSKGESETPDVASIEERLEHDKLKSRVDNCHQQLNELIISLDHLGEENLKMKADQPVEEEGGDAVQKTDLHFTCTLM